jgi:DNA-binding transcriptional LysR family regulator
MSPRLETDQLQMFAAVAESGSFTRAGAKVGRSQSAVSMQIKQLEETLGCALFERLPRGVQLTAQGELVAARAREILSMMDRTLADVRGDSISGVVRVGVPEEFSASLLPDVLARFARAHRHVEVTVDCQTSDQIARRLDAGNLDLAVVIIDEGNPEGETLINDPTVWVTSQTGAPHLDDPLPVAMFEQDCWWRDWALRSLERQGRAYRVAYTSRSTSGIQAAVSSGLAVAVLSQSMVPAGARKLDAGSGFIELPSSRVVLRMGSGIPTDATAGMATAIRECFRSELELS